MNHSDHLSFINRPRTISYHHNKASKLAIDKTYTIALGLLKRYPGLKEFIMGMGTYFFVNQKGENINCTEEYYTNNVNKKYFEPLVNHITKWDEIYKITGEPMRFTKNGKITKDW